MCHNGPSLCCADCFSMPMMIHAAIALISSALFPSVALLLVMADHELKVRFSTLDISRRLQCLQHGTASLVA